MPKVRYPIAVSLTVMTTCLVVAVVFEQDGDMKAIQRSATQSEQQTPRLEFLRFDETIGEPFAILRLHNRSDRPIYFAAHGAAYPLQTWERRENGKWVECGYDWCGTGRTIQQLGADAQLDIKVRLREYKTDRMPAEPLLRDYRDSMRLILYYGHSEKDIHHPIRSDSFCGGNK